MLCAISGSTGVLGSEFLKFCKNKKYKFVKLKGDIRKKKNLKKWLKSDKIEIIIHFAAIVPVNKVERNFSKAYDINVNSVRNILEIFKNKKKKVWFFLASTSHVYELSKKKLDEKSRVKPINKYGYSKFLAEKILLNKRYSKFITPCIGRIFSYTNYNQGKEYLIPSLHYKEKVNINKLNHLRDFVHIKDICSAINLLLRNKKKGIFNIGSGKKVHLIDIYNQIKNQNLNRPSKPITQICSNPKKLKTLGWKPKKNIFKILNDYKIKKI